MEHIKLNAGDPETRATPAQIREAARHGLQIWHHGTRCRIASNCNGFITAVTDDGAQFNIQSIPNATSEQRNNLRNAERTGDINQKRRMGGNRPRTQTLQTGTI